MKAVTLNVPKRDFLSIVDAHDRLDSILSTALDLKRRLGKNGVLDVARGRTLGLIFEKPSTRTRVSFEVGFRKLGGEVIVLHKNDIQLGRGETIRDTATVLSRFLDVIAYRAFRSSDVHELATQASIPVLNGLDDEEHPCQVVADFLTLREHFGKTKGLEFAYVGDGDNNVAHSYLLGAPLVRMNIRILAPRAFRPRADVLAKAQQLAKAAGTTIAVGEFSRDSLKGADVVATDTWVSMGDEKEEAKRLEALRGYTVDEKAMASTGKKSSVFIHCLPAHYGHEVLESVVYGPQSLVFDEAENRMWAQMALLLDLLGLRV